MVHSRSTRPQVRGKLSATSLPELLVLALDRKLHGSVVIKTPTSTKSALYFHAGRVTKVRTPEPVEPLGRLLLSSGAIDGSTLDAALHRARRDRSRLGSSLVQLRALDPAALDKALEQQLIRRVAWVGSLPPGSVFGYYEGIDFLTDRPACHADPLAVLWRCVRDAPHPAPQERAVLGPLIGSPLRLHPAAAPERFELSAEERAWLDAARSDPRPLSALFDNSGLGAARARRLIYALALTRQLERAASTGDSRSFSGAHDSGAPDAGSAAAGARRAPAPPPPASHPSPTAITRPSMPAAITRRPGPSSSAPTSPSSSTPDPSRPNTQRDEARAAVELAAACGQRASVLPGATDSAPAHSARGSSKLVDHGRAAAGAQAFHLAHAWLARKQFERAQSCAQQAREAAPDNLEYLALHAWLRAHGGELSRPREAAQILAQLNRAVMKDRENVAIRFYRAQVLERLGRAEDAYRDFRFVARRKPDHIDAVRAVRLHEMRARNARTRSGVLSRLFLR